MKDSLLSIKNSKYHKNKWNKGLKIFKIIKNHKFNKKKVYSASMKSKLRNILIIK